MIEQSTTGDSVFLDEILEIQINALRQFSEDTDTEPSALRRLIESLIDCEIGSYSVYVSKGFMRKTWTPIVTINLDQLTGVDGFAKQLEAVMMMLRNCLPKLKRNTFKLGGNHLSFHPDCDFCKYTEEAGGVPRD